MENENFILNLTASCTKDQAVLCLMGVEPPTIDSRWVRLDENGQTQEPVNVISWKGVGLEEYLSSKYREALSRYYSAVAKAEEAHGVCVDEVVRRELRQLGRMDDFVERAREIHVKLVDSLASGTSCLRVDRYETEKSGELHITLQSLKEWSDNLRSKSNHVSPGDAEVAVDSQNDAVDLKEALSALKKGDRSVWVTFALCAEVYAKDMGESFWKTNNEPNLSELARAISLHGVSLVKEGNFPNQSEAAIRRNLTAAFKIKKQAMRER